MLRDPLKVYVDLSRYAYYFFNNQLETRWSVNGKKNELTHWSDSQSLGRNNFFVNRFLAFKHIIYLVSASSENQVSQ